MRGAYLLYLAGLLVVMMGLLVMPASGLTAYGDHLSTINSGSMNQPAKVAVDTSNGDIYVADAGGKTVKKYSSAGLYDAGFGLSVSGTPVGIDLDASNVFVGDDTNDCVWIYDRSGNLADLPATGTTHKLGGASGPSLKMPNTVRVVKDAANHAVHVFVVDGDSDKVYIFDANGSLITSFGVSGSNGLEFYYPTGLAIAGYSDTNTIRTQTFYVGDQGNNRVQKVNYNYDTVTKAITSMPAYVSSLGTGAGDSFGKFLRVSDISWDSNFNRLFVVDSLQMVVQVFANDVPMTPNTALNYGGAPGGLGYLNVPTGIAMNTVTGEAVVTSNQDDALALFDVTDGTPPNITALAPTADEPPVISPYSIGYTVEDTDSATVTMSFYYQQTGPADRVMIGSAVVDTSTGPYSGSFNWDWTTLPLGSYYIYATAVDTTNNNVNATSTGRVLVVGGYDGCSNYTNAMYALYGASSSDFDGDGLSNCDELNGTNHTDAGNTYTSEMSLMDTDDDGLTDGEEDNAKVLYSISCYLNPRDGDTDGGGTSDYVEIQNATDPCNGSDDDTISYEMLSVPIKIGDPSWKQEAYAELYNTSASEVVCDISFKDVNGNELSTALPITVPPSGTRVVRVDDYTTQNNVVLDIRSSQPNAIIGNVAGNIIDYYDDRAYFDDYGVQLRGYSGTTLASDQFNEEFSGYKTWFAVRNPGSTTVDVAMNVYNYLDGSPAGTVNFQLAPYTSRIVKLFDEGFDGGQYNAVFNATGGSISGYMMQVRMNKNGTGDPNVVDFAYGANLEPVPTATDFTLDTFNDGKYTNYITWVAARNPDPTKTITIRADYYIKPIPGDNNTPTTFLITKFRDVAPNASIVWSPCGKAVNGGDEINGLDGNGQPNGGQFNAKFTVYEQGVPSNPMPASMMYWTFKKNTEFDNPASPYYKINDYCEGGELSTSSNTVLYAPHWRGYKGAIPGKDVDWLQVRNNDTVSGTVTVKVYDNDGNLVNQSAYTLPPNDHLAVTAQSIIGASQYPNGVIEGSMKVESTVQISGFMKRFKTNYADFTLYDKCNSIQLIPAP